MHQFDKQPAETYFIYGGITNVIATGDTIVIGDCTVEAVDNVEEDVASTILDTGTKAIYDTTKVKVLVKPAGTVALSPYKITFKIATLSGEIFEVDVFMTIKDI